MKNKKSIIALLIVLCVGLVGLTIAYFSNTDTIDNLFSTKEYATTYTEEFVSPDNWLPGDTTTKNVIATNTGQVDQAVRISLTEEWKSKNGDTLSGLIDSNGVLTDEEENSDKAAIINFSDNNDWTYNNGYYYYNYKLAPNETTSSLIDSVTFNPKVTLGDTCIENETETGKTITCNSSSDDYDNATYKLIITIETVQYNKYNEVWSTDVAIAEKPLSGVDTLLMSAVNADGTEYNATTKSKMFKMSHPATEQTPAQTEYRYIGDNPNNYVYFNCDSLDNQNSTSCEVWRIIGVFDVDDGTGNYEQRIKLVRGSALPDTQQWDNRTPEGYSSESAYGKNDWVSSVMQTYLNENGNYYKRTGAASTYGLKVTAKSLISNAKYYLGGMHYDGTSAFGTADAIYLWERGTETFSFENTCLYHSSNTKCETANYCENNPSDELCTAIRNTSWVGEVALMYLSDQYLVYANGVDASCYNNPSDCINDVNSGKYGMPTTGWIHNSNNLEGQNSIEHNWFISPYSVLQSNVFSSYGGSLGFGQCYSSYGVRPVLYLSSNVKITDGTGEQNNPYKLGL